MTFLNENQWTYQLGQRLTATQKDNNLGRRLTARQEANSKADFASLTQLKR